MRRQTLDLLLPWKDGGIRFSHIHAAILWAFVAHFVILPACLFLIGALRHV